MVANRRTLESIFDQSIRFVAPLFQRPYVWTKADNWEPLWEPILRSAEGRLLGEDVRPHFLGSVVLDQLRTPTGGITTRELIDGQQRLTTLQVILAVIRDVCSSTGQDPYRQAFDKWVTNTVPPRSTDPNDIFKVWPTNVDREQFRKVMTATVPDALSGPSDGTRKPNADNALLEAAYSFFHGAVSQWLNAGGDSNLEDRLNALYVALKEDLVFVVIDLDDKDDAQQIFETMNALGTPLLPADLIKNFLFRRAEMQGLDVNDLYEIHWRPFDEEKSFWRKEVKQGRLKRPRVDLFLQHYLTLQTLKETVTTELFGTYKVWSVAGNTLTVPDQLRQLRHFGDVYQEFSKYPADTRQGIFFRRLETLETSTVFPLLLHVFGNVDPTGNTPGLLQILSDIESFLVRRLVCGLTTKNYNRLFLELLNTLVGSAAPPEDAVRAFLVGLEGDSTRWPNDDEFGSAWLNRNMYALSNRKISLVLGALDSRMQTKKTEPFSYAYGNLTIEHLLPQSWEEHWPLDQAMAGEFARQQRESALHTFGNLTLVTNSLNPSVSNGPWAKKREAILQHSALNLNRGLAHCWNEAEIHARGQALLSLAICEWPHPTP